MNNTEIRNCIEALIQLYPKTFSQQIVKHKYQNLYREVLRITSFLDRYVNGKINITISTRFWHIINDILTIDKIKSCKYCGEKIIRNRQISKLSKLDSDFCNRECKNSYFLKKKNDITGLSEADIKYWRVKEGLSYSQAVKKVRQYKPNFIDYWIRLGYSKDEALQKKYNYSNKARVEYWICRGYSEIDANIEVENEIYKRNSKRKKRKEYWIEKGFSEEDAKELARKEYTSANPTCYNYWLSRGYSKQQAELEVRKRTKTTKEYWIAKDYSEDDAESIAKDTALSSCQANPKYWQARGYSDGEAIEMAKNNGVHFEAANKKFTKKQNHFCKEYWIEKGFSEETAKELARKENSNATKDIPFEVRSRAAIERLQKRSKDEVETTNKRLSVALKSKNKTHSPIFIEYWIFKGFTKEEAIQKVKETKYLNSESLSHASKIEIKFFDDLQQFLNIKITLQKWVQINNKVFCQDGRFENIVFEFNGTNFHMDPRKYKNGDYNPRGVPFTEVKRKDNEKYQAYMKKKYLTIEIWENDYKKQRDKLFSWIKNIVDSRNNLNNIYFVSSLDI